MNLDDKIPGSVYFTWREALWLPKWNRAANEADGLTEEVKQHIIKTAKWMDAVRAYFGKSINVHCWFRPEEYNKLVKGAKNSAHKFGDAVDFDVSGMSCDDAKKKLLDDKMLDKLKLRAEDNGHGAGWVHLDDRSPGPGGRFFKP